MNQKHSMMTQIRPMAVFHKGIWQRAEGVWLNVISPPYKVRVILNSKEMIFDGQAFADLNGFNESEIKFEIIRLNIGTLPKSKEIQQPIPTERRARIQADPYDRPYRIINRNGRPHAVPFPPPEPITDWYVPQPPETIVNNGDSPVTQ